MEGEQIRVVNPERDVVSSQGLCGREWLRLADPEPWLGGPGNWLVFKSKEMSWMWVLVEVKAGCHVVCLLSWGVIVHGQAWGAESFYPLASLP